MAASRESKISKLVMFSILFVVVIVIHDPNVMFNVACAMLLLLVWSVPSMEEAAAIRVSLYIGVYFNFNGHDDVRQRGDDLVDMGLDPCDAGKLLPRHASGLSCAEYGCGRFVVWFNDSSSGPFLFTDAAMEAPSEVCIQLFGSHAVDAYDGGGIPGIETSPPYSRFTSACVQMEYVCHASQVCDSATRSKYSACPAHCYCYGSQGFYQ